MRCPTNFGRKWATPQAHLGGCSPAFKLICREIRQAYDVVFLLSCVARSSNCFVGFL